MIEDCLIQYDGISWNVIEDRCPQGKHCDIPTEPGGPFEYRFVDCVNNG